MASWQISGEYMETCNCAFLCPCTSSNLAAQLQFPLHALEALRGVFIASDNVTREEMRRAAAAWLTPESHLHTMGWGEAVLRENLSAYQAAVRSSDLSAFEVFDRSGSPAPAADDRLGRCALLLATVESIGGR